MRSRSLTIGLILFFTSYGVGQTVNPGRVNVVTTPWSVNWLTHNADGPALTDLGYSAWEQSLIGSADLVTWLTTGGAGAPAIALVDDATWPVWATTAALGVYNVRHYGAAGDGVADDTAEFAAALTAIETAGGGCLYVPRGLYRCTSELTWNPAARHYAIAIVGDGIESRVFQETADANLFVLGDVDDGDVLIQGAHVRDICLMTEAGTGTALQINGAGRSQIDSVYVLGAGAYGVHLRGCIITEINRLTATSNMSDHEPVGPTIAAPTVSWFQADRMNAFGTSGGIGANVFTTPCIEGGSCNGITINGSARGWTISGGAVEGITAPGAAFVIHDVDNLVLDNVYVEASTGTSTLTEVHGGRIYLNGNNSWLISDCNSLDISGLISMASTTTFTVDDGCRNIDVSGLVNSQRMSQIRIENTETELGYVIDATGTYDSDAAQWGAGMKTRACPIMVNGMQRWDDANTPSAPWTIEGTPNLGANTSVTWSGAQFSAKVRVASPETYDGISYSIPDAFLGQWVSIEAWVYVESGTCGLWVYSPSRQLANVTHTGGWVRMQGSMKASGAQRVFRIISGTATIPDTVFYVGAVNIYCESDSTFRADGAGSPVGVVTPSTWGQEYYDATNGKWYKSDGFTDTDWVALN